MSYEPEAPPPRSISWVSSWPSNNANFTPFEADAVSNMVVLLAVAISFVRNSRKRSHHAAADESIAGWYWSILRDRTIIAAISFFPVLLECIRRGGQRCTRAEPSGNCGATSAHVSSIE